MGKKTLLRFLKIATHRITAHITGTLGVGLIILTPFIIVSWVVKWITTSADDLLKPLSDLLPFVSGTTGLGLGLLVTALYLIGLIAIYASGRKVIGLFQQITLKIPFIKGIYKPAKDFTELFKNGGRDSRVVGAYIHGEFVLGLYASRVLVGQDEKPHINFYYLTSPTPNSGLVYIIPEEEVYEILIGDWKTNDLVPMPFDLLMRHCMSCGTSSPPKFIRRPLVKPK